jgi:hypothetical protein
VLAYYVTAHGYGHGVRSCDILNALHTIRPDLPLTVVSDLAGSFFESRLPAGAITLVPGSFDTGMVQLDSIRVDLDASLEAARTLCRKRTSLVKKVAHSLRTHGARCIVADIPAVPLEAAAEAGIPGIALGNFGWDWIYSGLGESDGRWNEIAECFADGYRKASCLLRLPFSEPMSVFSRIEDLGLVSSPGTERRKEIARLHACDPGRKWVLLCFTNLAWGGEALARVAQLRDYEFFTVRPLVWEGTRIHAVDRSQIRFSDLVASVDCVVSKPGFGIVSDCVANSKPLIYADRSHFREYGVLESAIRRYLRGVHIPVARLYAGELSGSLESIWMQPPPAESVPRGGAEHAAARILEFFDSRDSKCLR